MNPLHPEQVQENVHTWAQASANASRFQQVKQATIAEMSWLPEAEAADYGQVAAWLDRLAQNRQLKIIRGMDGGYAYHKVLILEEEEDGEVFSTDIGGYVSMAELRMGAHGGTGWLYAKEEVADGWVRIEVMITDTFPQHEMFKRANGDRIELGFNDNEHFYSFTVTIHKDDLRF